jgi:hypothetical protein
VVDANSFWVDGCFEETNLAPIRVGDPRRIKLMGHSEILRGHVDSIARAIGMRTRNNPLKGSPTSTRFSRECAWPSASRFTFISMRCHLASSFLPA